MSGRGAVIQEGRVADKVFSDTAFLLYHDCERSGNVC